MEFAAKLRKLMEMKGFNQPGLAKAVGTHQPQVWAWLNKGVIPTIPLALRVARVLGTSLDYLVDSEREEPEPVGLSEAQQRLLWAAETVGYEVAARRIMAGEPVWPPATHAEPPPRPVAVPATTVITRPTPRKRAN